jgi:hypothetical protein
MPLLSAIEDKPGIQQAVNDFRAKFKANSKRINISTHKSLYWHPKMGIWGYFEDWKINKNNRRVPRFWSVFGYDPAQWRRNLIVEINPSGHGVDRRYQGVVAYGVKQQRVLLHRGLLRIGKSHFNLRSIEAMSSWPVEKVHFSDGRTDECLFVADLNVSAQSLQLQISDFVKACYLARVNHAHGPDNASQLQKVLKYEATLSAEKSGSYELPPRDATVVERRHGDVWNALTRFLDQQCIRHSNRRVGRWGPDLFASEPKPLLFEIKTNFLASDIQQAVGQLLIYESLLKRKHVKILIIPQVGAEHIMEALLKLDVNVVTYEFRGRKVYLDAKALGRIVMS